MDNFSVLNFCLAHRLLILLLKRIVKFVIKAHKRYAFNIYNLLYTVFHTFKNVSLSCV